jgi:hypothetical protein
MYSSLGEKLLAKTRQQIIEKARDKETQRAFVGMKLHNENMRLLEMSKRLGGAATDDLVGKEEKRS